MEVDPTDISKPITKVNLTSTPATDADLAWLKPWTTLKLLDLSGTKITDAGLAQLQDLALSRPSTCPSPRYAGMNLVLGKLNRLENLDLSKTVLSDLALKQPAEDRLVEDALPDRGPCVRRRSQVSCRAQGPREARFDGLRSATKGSPA